MRTRKNAGQSIANFNLAAQNEILHQNQYNISWQMIGEMILRMSIRTEANKKHKKTYILTSIVVAIAIISLALLLIILNYNNVYSGVYVDGIDASGLTQNELNDLLMDKYNYELDNLKVTLSTTKCKERYALNDLNAVFDINATIKEAFSIGRKGNLFSRISEICNAYFNNIEIAPVIIFDDEQLYKIINKFYDKNLIPVENPSVEINDSIVTIKSGHHGESIDKEFVLNKLHEFIIKRNFSQIEVPIIIKDKEIINAEEFYNYICKEPVNASVRVENNILEVIPHENGRLIDKESLVFAVDEINKNENLIKYLPVTSLEPDITTEKLYANLFKDVLSSFKTYFLTDSQYNIDRNENLRIATECINNTILAPGDVFSFNQRLGERTEQKGYKPAKIFSAGKVVDSVGGGICQVSSTLYNAVLRADLEIIERHNHSFAVSYLPPGYDAAVAYEVLDFKFKNTSEWPIKIEGKITSANELIFSIIGTNVDYGKSLEFYTQVIETTNYSTIYIDDPTIPEGKTIIKQFGTNGCIVDTYKIVKRGGSEINRKKLYTSVYLPLSQEVIRGTKKEAPQEQQVIQEVRNSDKEHVQESINTVNDNENT